MAQKLKKRSVFIILLQLLTSLAVFGQSEVLKNIVNKYNSYSENHLQEKLFVHIDRNFYLTGETLWYKIYAVNASNQEPLDFSKVAYLEVLDKDQHAVLQCKVPMSDAEGDGVLFLPNSMNSGNYQVRAYTNWMKNSDPAYFFSQQITVINTSRNLGLKPVSVNREIDFQFFPEGGNLVDGILSKVAFKATDNTGKGIYFKGFVLNQHNDTVARFQPLKFGMGSFTFMPSINEKYTAFVTAPEGRAFSKDLPKIFKTGYVLKLQEPDKEHLRIDISANTDDALSGYGTMYLIGHTYHEIKIAEYAKLDGGKASFIFEKNKLGDGISHFTLFNASGQPLCERLYLKIPEHRLNIEVDVSAKTYSPRQKIDLALLCKDELGKPVTGSMSMSVSLADSITSEENSHIENYLWLSSDLKGFIESPAYYFSSHNDAKEALDNLLLTQGWRRFNWENVLNTQSHLPDFIPELEGHIIQSKVIETKTGRTAKNVTAYLSSPGKVPIFYGTRSDDLGNVFFPVKNLYGHKELILQTGPDQENNFYLEILNPFSEKYSDQKLSDFDFPLQLQKSLLLRSINSEVESAYSERSNRRYLLPNADSLPFYGNPDKSYYLDKYTRFPVMEEVMREYVLEVNVQKRKGKFYYKVLDIGRDRIFADEPLILLDGLPIFNTDKIVAFDPKKIERLDILAVQYFLGPEIYPGIVSYSTYDGDLGGFELDPKVLVLDYEGLQFKREFYAPRYENTDTINSRIPDFRNLLFWSPALKTDTSGKLATSFYASDQEGSYLIVVQGITKSGRPGSKIISFEVKKTL